MDSIPGVVRKQRGAGLFSCEVAIQPHGVFIISQGRLPVSQFAGRINLQWLVPRSQAVTILSADTLWKFAVTYTRELFATSDAVSVQRFSLSVRGR